MRRNNNKAVGMAPPNTPDNKKVIINPIRPITIKTRISSLSFRTPGVTDALAIHLIPDNASNSLFRIK